MIKELYQRNAQVVKFILVGFVCYLVVLGQLILLVDFFGVEVNLANAIASFITIFVCYLLNVRYVFTPGRHSRTREVSAFFLFASLGYLLNLLLMYLFTAIIPMWYVLAKTLVVLLVALFNFLTRKRIVFLE